MAQTYPHLSPLARLTPWLLPHELILGGFLALTWVRLFLDDGLTSGNGWLFFFLFVGGASLVAVTRIRPRPDLWRLRLGYAAITAGVSYLLLRDAVPVITPTFVDNLLLNIDRLMLGETPGLFLEPLARPWITEIMSLCYALFIPYVLISVVRYVLGDLSLGRRFYAGLFSVYGLGFFGYSWLPAVGPYIFLADQFHGPLIGGWITAFNQEIVVARSILVDVFPSLHCAVSGFILFFDRRYNRARYRLWLIPVAGLWVSTVYLRYHYMTDVLAGAFLAAVGLWIASRTNPNPAPSTR